MDKRAPPAAPSVLFRAELKSLSVSLRGTEHGENAPRLTGSGRLCILDNGIDITSWRGAHIEIRERSVDRYGTMHLGPLGSVEEKPDGVSLYLQAREFDLLITARLGACPFDLELRLMGTLEGDADDIFGAQYEVLRYSLDLREPSHAA